MSYTKDTVGEAAKGIRSIFGRLADFFHIFDLSFFVSGVSAVGAISYSAYRLDLLGDFPFPDWVSVLAFLIAAYIFGLLTFSAGRLLNGKLFRRRKMDDFLWQAITDQRLSGAAIRQHQGGDVPKGFALWRLYIRMWQQFANEHSNSMSFHHTTRYWAMAATYDGVAASLLLWSVVSLPIEFMGGHTLPGIKGWVVSIGLIGCAVLCFWQAARYYEYQIEDLVAALASMKVDVD